MTTTLVDQSSPSRTAGSRHDAPDRSYTVTGELTGQRQSPRSRELEARASSAKTKLFGLAVVAVVAGATISLLGLVVTGPGQTEATTVSGSAAIFGMVGMYSAIGGGLLAVIAALRSQS